jgi:deazaflavin-dependent oxidoreductase (nitroreductase family)
MFKFIINIAIFLYKLTNGAIGGSMQGLPVLLLTTTGRKSGQPRTVPLGYLRDGSNYVIIASNGGRPRHPAWFFNLQSQPEVTIQVKNVQMKVRAEQANPEKRRELWTRLIQVSPGYGNYEKRTNREIPVMILTPLHKG